MKEKCILKIIIDYDNINKDTLGVKFSAPTIIGLGLIQRARIELDKLEKKVMENSEKNSRKVEP